VHPFVADALQAGYVWDAHYVSVGNKQMRKPKKDGWFEHGMNCLEYGEHNFGGVQPTIEQSMRRAARVRSAEGRRVERQLPVDDMTRKYDRLVRTRAAGGRGGY